MPEIVTQKGRPSLTKTDDGRLRVVRRYNVRADALELATIDTLVFHEYGTADGKYTNCILIDHYVTAATAQGVEHELVRVFEEIGNTPVQLGGVSSRMADSRAFVGTDEDGKVVVGATRFAREWTVRYIVKGDSTIIDGNWLAVNATKSFGSRTGYFTGTSTTTKGSIYSTIGRVYTECPDRLVFDRPDRYTFPSKIGLDGPEPCITEPQTTRTVDLEIEETYHVGEVAKQTIEWEVLYWARGTITFTPTGESISGVKSYVFDGAIGTATISASNRIFNGYKCSTIAGTISSSPDTYPTGKKRIASIPRPWKGDIWKRTNVYVTFPS